MFHKRTGQIAAILILMSVSAQPMMAQPGEQAAPAAIIVSDTSPVAVKKSVSDLRDLSFDAFRHDTRVKVSKTKSWVKDKTHLHEYENPVKILEGKIDRFQDRVKPAGRTLKASLQSHTPGKSLAVKGDRNFSVFGLLLMAAFGLVVLLMSLSSPMSRLGGRH